MYNYSDFESFFIRYKAEAVPAGESLQSFCSKNKVPYNLFHKWYKDTRHKLVPVQVEGYPSQVQDCPSTVPPSSSVKHQPVSQDSVRIMVEIRMTNGLYVSQRNLSYQSLKRLIESGRLQLV